MYIDNDGYLVNGSGQKEHRRIVEEVLKRKLKPYEKVHHIDCNKQNNSNSNLLVCTDKYHKLIHARTDCIKAGFNPETYSRCSYHKTWEPIEQFSISKRSRNGLDGICILGKKEYRSKK